MSDLHPIPFPDLASPDAAQKYRVLGPSSIFPSESGLSPMERWISRRSTFPGGPRRPWDPLQAHIPNSPRTSSWPGWPVAGSWS